MTNPQHDWDHYYGADDDDDGYGEAHDAQECDHSDYEISWEGVASCYDCGAKWSASPAEARAYDEAMQRHAIEWARMERREA